MVGGWRNRASPSACQAGDFSPPPPSPGSTHLASVTSHVCFEKPAFNGGQWEPRLLIQSGAFPLIVSITQPCRIRCNPRLHQESRERRTSRPLGGTFDLRGFRMTSSILSSLSGHCDTLLKSRGKRIRMGYDEWHNMKWWVNKRLEPRKPKFAGNINCLNLGK